MIINTASSQGLQKDKYISDYLFPEKGKSLLTLSTGIPYVAIAEYSYGFTDRFSVGVLAGTTPSVEGYGIRIKSVLFENDNDSRVYAKIPMLYYPQTKGLGGEPWLLTWPVINYEKKLKSGIRFSYGIGVVAAACANDMMDVLGIGTHEHGPSEEGHHQETGHLENITTGHQHDQDHHGSMVNDHHQDTMDSGEEGFMGDVWNTIQTGVTLPLTKQWIFQAEIAAVMKGYKIAGEEWVGGPPVILTLGVTKRF